MGIGFQTKSKSKKMYVLTERLLSFKLTKVYTAQKMKKRNLELYRKILGSTNLLNSPRKKVPRMYVMTRITKKQCLPFQDYQKQYSDSRHARHIQHIVYGTTASETGKQYLIK